MNEEIKAIPYSVDKTRFISKVEQSGKFFLESYYDLVWEDRLNKKQIFLKPFDIF